MNVDANNEKLKAGSSKGLKAWLIKEIMGPVMIGLVIFLCAGTIKWIHGWIFLGGIVLIKVLGDPWLLKTYILAASNDAAGLEAAIKAPIPRRLIRAIEMVGARPLRQTNYEFPPRVTRRPAGKTPAAEPDPRCIGHVRVRARDGASGRPEPTGRNSPQDGDPTAASRESAVEDRGNDRWNAEFHRTG